MTSLECRTARRGLGPYRDGELPPTERSTLEAHLASCVVCAGMFADAQTLGGLLRLRADSIGEGLPPDFTARVMSALPAERSDLGAAWLRFWEARRPLLVGAAALTAVAAAVLVPLLVNGRSGRSNGAAENEAHIHRLAVQSPGAQPLVFQNDLGETVIWVVPEGASGGEAGAALPEDPKK
jgi:anti-sigma factor RsiW